MLGRGNPVRLAQTLAKAATILVVIAVTLGGAVALGSTLFESPPRDAAEFAARIEAGSTHARPAEKRTAAERRYVLELSELCARRNEELRDLDLRVPSADRIPRLRSWRAILARHSEGFAAITAPKLYREDAARAEDLSRGMLDLSDSALEAWQAGDRNLFEARVGATELLDERYDRTMLRLEAPACVTH